MVAIQNQQTDLLYFLSINSTELTEGNRKCSIQQDLSTSDIETAGGRIKRFYSKNKRTLSVSYSYVSSNTDHTVDGRAGRDFIHNLALNNPYVQVSYVDKPDGPTITWYGFISNYRETIIRRDILSQCIYYDVQFSLEEE